MSMGFSAATHTQPHQMNTDVPPQVEICASANGQPQTPYFSATPLTSGKQPLPQPHAAAASTKEATSVNKSAHAKRTSDECEIMTQTAERFNSCLAHDQELVSHPDVDSQFVDEEDVINRLLPYHIFQQPKEDLGLVILGKGKEKVAEVEWKEEIQVIKSALEYFKRSEAIHDRWRKLKIRSGKRVAPSDQAYYLAQVVLDADRSENAWLGNELRTARTEAERLEREKRATATVARLSHFVPTSQTALQAQYYRGYPYAYSQVYGSVASAPAITSFPVAPTTPTNYSPYQSSGAIPVQLPVASLPALHALGIIPVPATALPQEGQPQPPAVLRGSTANGTILSLEINVSLLQSAQMSGLAMVLNSLVTRNSASMAS